jgi:nucleoside-diphosphate-sugar epimerase
MTPKTTATTRRADRGPMARALLVGCGCHGRELGSVLRDDGWAVRGTTRRPERIASIRNAGLEGAIADPDRVGTVLDQVGDVAVVIWLMGSAAGTAEELEAVNVLRLGSLLEKLVDTPVRGFVFEGAGSTGEDVLAAGAALVERAARTWMIPVRVVTEARDQADAWRAAMLAAAVAVLSGA